jgi:hypothetical protein
MKEKNGIMDFEQYAINPSSVYEEDIKSITYIKKGDVRSLHDMSTGEEVMIQNLDNVSSFSVDNREYRKVYVNGLNSISELSSSGLRVWCYILARLSPKKNEITINMSDALDYTGYKGKMNIYNGIINLLENGLLFRKNGSGSYYININIFFNGNRIK